MKFWIPVSVLGLMSSYAFADGCPSGDQLIKNLPDGTKIIVAPLGYKLQEFYEPSPTFVLGIRLHSTTLYANGNKINDNIIQNLALFQCTYNTWDANGEWGTYLYADYVKGKSYHLSGD